MPQMGRPRRPSVSFKKGRPLVPVVPRKKPVVSTAAVVRESIDTHPSTKDGMRMGLPQAPPKARAVCTLASAPGGA